NYNDLRFGAGTRLTVKPSK
uniref:Uncharacterized protein n=2 Tax=Laurasiatheria TaxID=314145 RepID=A0A8C6BDG2_MONMO